VSYGQGNGEWDSKVLQTLAGWVDLHSIHLYTTLGQERVPGVKGLEYENNVFGPAVSYLILFQAIKADVLGGREEHRNL
jgi:hypothetical protein